MPTDRIFAAGNAPAAEVPQKTKAVTLTTDNMSLSWDESGAVSSVALQGKECVVSSLSGFFITDAKYNKRYAFTAPLTGEEEWKQTGTVEDAGLTVDVTYRREGHAIVVEGSVADVTGADRMIHLDYFLPVCADGMYWYDDISTRQEIKAGRNYDMPAEYCLDGHKMSLYPYGAVSNGEQAAALAVPMEPPQSFLIGYKHTSGYEALTVRFDFALTDKTAKTASRADFSFVIYAPTLPEWGFRSASQDYYDLFPEYFEVKSNGGGNWLFQHSYEQVEGVEDFYFGYNETPSSYKFDEEHGVTSLEYTAPAEQWMEWPGMPKEPEPTYEQYMDRFSELLADESGEIEPGFPAVTKKNAAEAMKNSAVYLDNGNYFTVGWYAYGVSVCFVTNHNPDIPGWNGYKLQLSEIERAERAAEAEGSRLGGVYIDNLAGLGSYNYREEHFQYADMPLLWDRNGRLAIPTFSSSYSYTKAVRARCDENGQIVMANMVFPERGIAQYIHMVDVPGSECGPDWGWDPYIQRLRRTMAYRKPWMLLLGHATGNSGNWGASEASYEAKENVMRSAVAYGLFANVIGYRVPLSEYEASRPIFRKYTYIAVVQDKLGWEPITYAAVSGTGGADCERFGDPASGAAIFTVYNTGEEKSAFGGTLNIDLSAMKVSGDRTGKLMAFDMIGNAVVPVTIRDGVLAYAVTLEPLELSAVMIGTKEEIFSWMFERVRSTLQRGDRAAERIGKELRADMIPAQWTALDEALRAVSPFGSMSSDAALADVGTLLSGMQAVLELSSDSALTAALPEYASLLRADIKNICGDACAILNGLGCADAPDAGNGENGGAKNSALPIAAAAALLLAAAGGAAAIRRTAKKKKQ